MKLTFQLTIDDFRELRRAVVPWAQWMPYLIPLGILAVIGLLIWQQPWNQGLYYVAAAPLCLLVAAPLLNRRTLHKLWNQQSADVRYPITIEVKDDGLLIQTENSIAQTGWPLYSGVRETPTLLLLRMSASQYRMIPKRAFSGVQQLEEFRELLRQRLHEGA